MYKNNAIDTLWARFVLHVPFVRSLTHPCRKQGGVTRINNGGVYVLTFYHSMYPMCPLRTYYHNLKINGARQYDFVAIKGII